MIAITQKHLYYSISERENDILAENADELKTLVAKKLAYYRAQIDKLKSSAPQYQIYDSTTKRLADYLQTAEQFLQQKAFIPLKLSFPCVRVEAANQALNDCAEINIKALVCNQLILKMSIPFDSRVDDRNISFIKAQKTAENLERYLNRFKEVMGLFPSANVAALGSFHQIVFEQWNEIVHESQEALKKVKESGFTLCDQKETIKMLDGFKEKKKSLEIFEKINQPNTPFVIHDKFASFAPSKEKYGEEDLKKTDIQVYIENGIYSIDKNNATLKEINNRYYSLYEKINTHFQYHLFAKEPITRIYKIEAAMEGVLEIQAARIDQLRDRVPAKDLEKCLLKFELIKTMEEVENSQVLSDIKNRFFVLWVYNKKYEELLEVLTSCFTHLKQYIQEYNDSKISTYSISQREIDALETKAKDLKIIVDLTLGYHRRQLKKIKHTATLYPFHTTVLQQYNEFHKKIDHFFAQRAFVPIKFHCDKLSNCSSSQADEFTKAFIGLLPDCTKINFHVKLCNQLILKMSIPFESCADYCGISFLKAVKLVEELDQYFSRFRTVMSLFPREHEASLGHFQTLVLEQWNYILNDSQEVLNKVKISGFSVWDDAETKLAEYRRKKKEFDEISKNSPDATAYVIVDEFAPKTPAPTKELFDTLDLKNSDIKVYYEDGAFCLDESDQALRDLKADYMNKHKQQLDAYQKYYLFAKEPKVTIYKIHTAMQGVLKIEEGEKKPRNNQSFGLTEFEKCGMDLELTKTMMEIRVNQIQLDYVNLLLFKWVYNKKYEELLKVITSCFIQLEQYIHEYNEMEELT